MITTKDIKLEFASHISMTNAYYTTGYDKKHGITCQTKVKRLDEVRIGKSTTTWYLDGFGDTFKTVDEVVSAYNKLHHHPHNRGIK